MKRFGLIFILMGMMGCAQNKADSKEQSTVYLQPVQTAVTTEGYKKAYFASGCFWCSESIFNHVLGVQKVNAGYSGGKGENPNYQNYARKGYAETIEVIYDPRMISFKDLLTVYFDSQNATQQNGQGPDRGPGYRSIIFFQNSKQKQAIKEKIKELQPLYLTPIAAEVRPFKKFWLAEEYHQNFEEKHPNNPYILNVSIPRLHNFQQKHPELLKDNSQ